MASARQSNSSEIMIRGTYDSIFAACENAAQKIGNIKQSSRNLGAITIKTPMKMFPPKNPMTLRVSIMDQGDGCLVSCKAEGFDGEVGLGSAGKDIDDFYKYLDSFASQIKRQSAPSSKPAPTVSEKPKDIYGDLEKIVKLHDQGLLTDAEFAKLKADLLSRM